MKRCFFLMVIFLLTLNHTISEDKIKGSVKEYHEAHQMFHGLPGANVFWAGTTKGTTTDKMGEFTIKKVSGKKRLVISFVGYKNDTVEIEEGQKEITIVLSKGEELDEVMVEKRLGGAYISTVEPIKTEVITEKGLQQLACC